MAYRNKEDCLAEAKRLGIDAEGMSWPELQKAVSNALKAEELGFASGRKPTMVEQAPTPEPMSPKLVQERREFRQLQPYLGKTVMLSPELASERYRLLKYDEVLGDDFEVEERKFDMNMDTDTVFDVAGGEVSYDNVIDQFHDYTTGTFRLKKRGDRKVVAMSSVPKENSGMFFRPGVDYATVVTWKGRVGYLWKHWRYPNVKALLKESGYYQDYKKLFKDEPNVWYAAGKQLVCDIGLVHQVFKQIEDKQAKANAEERARLKQLGIDPDEITGGRRW